MGRFCTRTWAAASDGAVASPDGRPTSPRRPLEEETPSPPGVRRGGGGAGRRGRRLRGLVGPVDRDPGRSVHRAAAAPQRRRRSAPTRRDAGVPAGAAGGRRSDPGRAELSILRRAAAGLPLDLRQPRGLSGSVCSGRVVLAPARDRKSTRLNSSHTVISYAVFCLKKKKKK